MEPARDPFGPVPEWPTREPADHEVAAGAVAGLAAGLAVAGAALAASDQPSLFALRLVAASMLGHEALDPGWAAPVLLGAVLGALASVILALVFTGTLPRGRSPARSLAAGLAFGAASFALTWFVAVRLLDPVLFAAARPRDVLLLHLLHGAVLGLLLPPLRVILP